MFECYFYGLVFFLFVCVFAVGNVIVFAGSRVFFKCLLYDEVPAKFRVSATCMRAV